MRYGTRGLSALLHKVPAASSRRRNHGNFGHDGTGRETRGVGAGWCLRGTRDRALTASEGAGRTEAQAMAIRSRPRRALDSRFKTADGMWIGRGE